MKLGQLVKNLNPFARKGYFSAIFSSSLPGFKNNWSKTEFLRANEISLYLNKAINKRAEKVGEVRFKLMRGETEIVNDPRLNVLYKPNKFFTGPQFWELWQKYMDLAGCAFIWVVRSTELFGAKKITELHLLRPDLVSLEYEGGQIVGYKFHQPGGDVKTYKPEEIIYSFNPDPLRPLEGESLVRSGIRALELERQITEYQVNVLKNGGKVEGVFKFKTPRLTENQLKQLKADYDKEYAAAKNAGKPMFLGGDADYVKLGLMPEEMSYLETKRVTLDDVVLMTGVPKPLLGITTDETFANADAAIRIFLRETIKPRLKTLTAMLDLGIFPEQELDLTFIDQTPEDTEEVRKNVETGNKVNALTINEKREALGYDPVPGGDVILVPFNVMPFSDTDRAAEQKGKKFDLEHPLRDPFVRRQYGELYLKKFERREKQFLAAVNKYFREQADRLTDRLQPANTRVFRKKDLLDELFDLRAEITIAHRVFYPLLEEVLAEAGRDAMELVGSTPNFTAGDDVKGWLDNKVDVFSRSINETTFKELQRNFAESLAAGESRQELVKRVRNTYGDISKSRAQTIARTEIEGVTQKGTFEGYKQAGMPIKIWVAVGDSRTRDSHAAIDGQERPINMPFSNGLMFPGDPSGPAEETINCRCSI